MILGGADLLRRSKGVGRAADASPRLQLERLLLSGCYFVGTIGVAGRTGGQALLGLRVVDDAIGGRPGWRAALVWWAVRQPPELLTIPLSTSSRVRETTAKLSEAEPDAKALRRRLRGDQPGLKDALTELYKSRGIDPWRGYRPLLLAGLVVAAYGCVLAAGILTRPDRRALHDRVAGVVVVRESPDT